MRDTLIRFRGSRSQKEMAKRYGVSQQAWSQYETGEIMPKPAIMLKIAEDAGLDAKDLFFTSIKQV